MYLFIGDERDSCCQAVAAKLRARGYSVFASCNPLAERSWFTWLLETERLSSSFRLTDRMLRGSEAIEGVLVRKPGGRFNIEDWAPEDLAYLHTEGLAALLAWLRTLPCPVVGRPTDNTWYRPNRPSPEWQVLLARCGLPGLKSAVVNTLEAARHFAQPCGGRVVYSPLTSERQYSITDADAWRELALVLERVPVCLIEPCAGPSSTVTLIGERIFWAKPEPRHVDVGSNLETGLRCLAATLESDFVQVGYYLEPGGVRCATVRVQPIMELHERATQDAIAAEITHMLTAVETAPPRVVN